MTALWLIGLLAVVAAGCRSVVPSGNDGPLTASGTIRASEVRVASDQGGRISEVRVAAGMAVQAGEVLAVIDATPWLLQLSVAEAAADVAWADLAVIEAGPRAEAVTAARALLAAAEAARDGAHMAWLRALEQVENPTEIDAQIVEVRTQVALAAQGAEMARAQLARQQLLRDQTAEGSVERRTADLQVRAAEESLAAAQADEQTARTLLDRLLRLRAEPLGLIAQANGAEGEYRLAEQAVAVAQAELDDLLAGPSAAEIAVAEAAARYAQAEVNVLRVQIERSELTSPIDGVVLGQTLRVGEIAAPAVTILTLADLDEVALQVYVPANRIGQVHVGQFVQVTVDSFPGRVFEGHVVRVGDEPEFTPRNVATAEGRLNTFYAVEIRLPNPDGALKPGMPADARF